MYINFLPVPKQKMMFEQHLTRPEIEIQTTHPYLIRASDTQIICDEFIDDNQEIMIKIPIYIKSEIRFINIPKKIIIAEHFILNSDPNVYRFVQQHDLNKLNLNPSNLYWVSSSKVPARKVQQREYVDSLPSDSVQIDQLGDYKFDHYHYSPSNCSAYLITKSGRIQKVSTTKRGNSQYMTFQDVHNISRCIPLNKIIRAYGR